MPTWAVIYNPASGSFSEKKLEAALRIWRGGGVETRVYPSRYAGHATILAREISGVERVVAYGETNRHRYASPFHHSASLFPW